MVLATLYIVSYGYGGVLGKILVEVKDLGTDKRNIKLQIKDFTCRHDNRLCYKVQLETPQNLDLK